MKKISIKIILLIFLVSAVLSASGGGETMSKNGPITVEKVDLEKYIGVWYEIAKIPNRFQKKCTGNTSAEYRIRKDGRIDVINKCDNKKGGVTIAKGIAKIVDKKSNSKLKVSFVKLLGIQLFWGDYWILGLEKDYKYAVIGDSKMKYGWILAREKELSEVQWSEIENILAQQGYDKKRFVKTTHSK